MRPSTRSMPRKSSSRLGTGREWSPLAGECGPGCMQIVRRQPGATPQPMSEDCLYLNVWTAADGESTRRPVIVWSHGGSFLVGAGSLPEYDGEELARKGVVVVTHNYR